VAGFRAWLKLGYCVTKGSTGIRIWAPCPPSRRQLEAWQQAGADPAMKPRTGWRLASVFAQDQVAPLPPPATPVPLDPPIRAIEGSSHEQLIAPLIDLAGEIGYTVTFDGSPEGDGYCQPRQRRIVISEHLAANGRLATLIHELGHALLAEATDKPVLCYAQEELVVESIAYCCCDTVGLDTSGNSIPYLSSWAESSSLEVLEQSAQLTDRLARRIEDALLAEAATSEPAHQELVDPVESVAV
jgi:hypothetical protein